MHGKFDAMSKCRCVTMSALLLCLEIVNGWIIDRYQVKTDKNSGILNDCNKWGEEHGNPRYILDLILSCITVSIKTREIVNELPEVEFEQ